MDEYAQHAHLYDPIVGPFLRSTHRDIVDIIKGRGKRSVLDLCCGTGLLAGKAHVSGLDVTGLDISPAMLAVARSMYPNIPFIECDATQTPLDEGPFDAITISFVLHEKPWETAQAILREALRLTRPDGLIVVADYRRPIHRRSFFTQWGIRCVERMAGREHHAHFREYMKRGGSHSFLVEAGFSATLHTTHMKGWSGVFVHQTGL